MAHYYVNTNAQPTGEHEVHRDGCSNPPQPQHRRSLGEHANCQSAVRAAGQIYSNVDGCKFCSPACHTR